MHFDQRGHWAPRGGRSSHRIEFVALISAVFYVECSSLHLTKYQFASQIPEFERVLLFDRAGKLIDLGKESSLWAIEFVWLQRDYRAWGVRGLQVGVQDVHSIEQVALP